MAIQRGKAIKSLNRDKLGQCLLFSFDESKRILAVCASTKVLCRVLVDFVTISDVPSIQLQLHVFVVR